MFEFYGEPPSSTLRVTVVLLDGRPVGLAGLSRTGLATWFFTEHSPELVPYLSTVTVWRAIKRALSFIAECRCTVYVISEDPKMMQRLHFGRVPGHENVWRN